MLVRLCVIHFCQSERIGHVALKRTRQPSRVVVRGGVVIQTCARKQQLCALVHVRMCTLQKRRLTNETRTTRAQIWNKGRSDETAWRENERRRGLIVRSSICYLLSLSRSGVLWKFFREWQELLATHVRSQDLRNNHSIRSLVVLQDAAQSSLCGTQG